MKAIRKLPLLLALLLPVPAFADDAAPEGTRRQGWFYSGGALRKVDASRWQEKNPAGLFTYKEVDRKPPYVELHDFGHGLSVRLYDTALYAWRADEGAWYLARTGRWDDPRKEPLDTGRNAGEREQFQTPSERANFPRLGHGYEVLAAATDRYNCISWSLGVTDRWLWPARPGLPITFGDFDDLYSRQGYRRLASLSFDKVPGHDKIVLFAKTTPEGVLQPTHAAKQQDDGSWTSKVGKLPLIRHLQPGDLEGAMYGAPYVVYVRERVVLPPPHVNPNAASTKSRTAEVGKSSAGAGPSPRSSGRSSGSAAGSP
jgi:hypothetical protein